MTGFDPDEWRTFYPNYAFTNSTAADRRWAAELVGQFTDEQIRTVVELAGYTYGDDARYVAETLIARRDRVAKRCLGASEGASR